MALDRTWYNTLVDDDGSGLTGSVWNKASVDHVYDDVDALFQIGSWTPGLGFGGSGGALGTFAGTFLRVDRLVLAEFHIALTSRGPRTGYAEVFGLPFPVVANTFHNGIVTPNSGMAGLTSAILSFAVGGQATLFLYQLSGSASVNLTEANFTNTSDIYGSIAYRTP